MNNEIREAFLKTIPEYPKFLTEKEVFNNPELILKWEDFYKGYTSRDEEVEKLKIEIKNKDMLMEADKAYFESLKCCGNCRYADYDHSVQIGKDICINSGDICDNWKGITND
jgi:hypothetical protein